MTDKRAQKYIWLETASGSVSNVKLKGHFVEVNEDTLLRAIKKILQFSASSIRQKAIVLQYCFGPMLAR